GRTPAGRRVAREPGGKLFAPARDPVPSVEKILFRPRLPARSHPRSPRMMDEQQALRDLVEVLGAEQRRRWLEGERVAAETYFGQHPELLGVAECALRLLYGEVMLREEAGDVPHLHEYERRFPQFAAQLRPLFEVHRALESGQLLD